MNRNSWFHRLFGSAVLWSWALNAFRIASGLLLLPLLLKVLPTNDLGMYYVFVSMSALLPILDFGFSASVGRYVSYAMAGATELKAHGLVVGQQRTSPNVSLLWKLLRTTQFLFRCLSAVGLLVIGGFGTWTISRLAQETSAPLVTWLAWCVALISFVFELYSSWWNVFLRATNEVVLSTRIAVIGYAVRLALGCVLLIAGAGLLALPMAGIVGSLLQRTLARQSCLRRLGEEPSQEQDLSLFAILWPNSWRVGLQILSSYFTTHANTVICSMYLGLGAGAQYGLSLQVAHIIAGMSAVWLTVKWPLVGQFRASGDHSALRALLRPRFHLQNLTFFVLAAIALTLGPMLLRSYATEKVMLPTPWLTLLLINQFLELQFSFWTTLLSTENRVPSLWPTVASNAISLVAVLLLTLMAGWGIKAFVVAPLAIGCLFNYWYWAKAGAKSLQTTWSQFILRPSALRPGGAVGV